jgi:nitroreductase
VTTSNPTSSVASEVGRCSSEKLTADAGASLVTHNGISAVDALIGRRSVRRFLPTPVSAEVIEAILTVASRAPSGVNSQPWMVHVVTGETRQRLSRAVLSAAEAGMTSEEYPYMPKVLKEPYLSRRRKVGLDLYARYGIDRHDLPARKKAMLRNFEFFGAPVGFFFVMDRAMELGSWLDCGMFMQSVMTVARAFGLETCPQQAWCDYGNVVHETLKIPAELILLSGMAIGHVDPTAPENALVTERSPPSLFAIQHV